MKYLLAMAHNTITHETIKTQELNGVRYTLNQRTTVELLAAQLAERMTRRTGNLWQGVVQEYTPTVRK